VNNTTKEIIYVVLLFVITTLISDVIWLLPMIIVGPLILAFTVDSAIIYLVLLAIYAEIFSVAPPGVATMVVWLPYLARRAWQGQVDVSLAFVSVLVMTVLAQMFVMFAPDMIGKQDIWVMPWTLVGPMLAMVTITSFLSIIAVYYNRSW
jgi:hypothetical protein